MSARVPESMELKLLTLTVEELEDLRDWIEQRIDDLADEDEDDDDPGYSDEDDE